MNKHGQTLVLFVILLPIILLLAALVVDMGVILNSKTKSKEVTKTIIRENFNDLDEEKVKDILTANNIATENLEITNSDNEINIKNTYEVESIFGSIIGIKSYTIKIDITGYKKNEKIIFEWIGENKNEWKGYINLYNKR